MTKKPKLINSIRAKLVSAVAMLLVAVIMVVSSTYAWFTLSTAPEITGIQTAIGANGALEIALRHSKDGEAEDVFEGMVKDGDDSNHYWGNLIDLDQEGLNYGVDKIVLLPSTLSATDDNLHGNMLSTPIYGADGRVMQVAPNAASGIYNPANGGAFYASNDFGFRGIGVASGLTERQLAYRTAKTAASTALRLAQDTASQSLSENGGSLANIALKKAMGNADTTFTRADVLSLLGITYDLLGDLSSADVKGLDAFKDKNKIGSLEYIEEAYMQYIVAYAAGTKGGAGEGWTVVKNAVEADGATLTSVIAELQTLLGPTVPTAISEPKVKYDQTLATVKEAQDGLFELYDEGADDTDYTWIQISEYLYMLANVDEMKVNGRTPDEVKEDMEDLATEVTGGAGINVTIATGGGVYADIADHCGDFGTKVNIDKIAVGGVGFGPISANMATKSTQLPSYLSLVSTALNENSLEYTETEGEADKPFTEMYGYVIDMAFRTNAKESNLLLQTTPVDRIYEGNTNEETMGGGSSMTFASKSSNFSNDDIKNLMKHIRIVFFEPGEHANSGGTIVAYAKLDADNATVGADGLTANMYLYKQVADEVLTINTWTDADGNIKYVDTNGKFVNETGAEIEKPEDSAFEGLTVETETKTLSYKEEIITDTKDAILAALPQDDEYYISALVYLDGETLTNADVAYDVSPSMSGKTNFQFSSSANLVPMEYGNLHHGDEGAGEGGGAGAATGYTVDLPDAGIETGADKATAGDDYTFTLADGYTLASVQVGDKTLTIGTDVTTTDNKTYTIPAASVTGNIVINVTTS